MSWTIGNIKQANVNAGQHYFSRSTMRFFRSRCDSRVFEGPAGIFFVTSEQFLPSAGPAEPRKYTVRQFNPETGGVSTFGDFNQIRTLDTARRMAKHACVTVAEQVTA